MKFRNAVYVTFKFRVLPLTREWIEMSSPYSVWSLLTVLPLTREWIEIHNLSESKNIRVVLPLTREWIEILFDLGNEYGRSLFSLSRGSGLKSVS